MNRAEGLTPRQAALTIGFIGLLTLPAAPFASFVALPRLVSPNIDQTVQNIAAHQGLFLGAMFSYLVNYICDLVTAWALYYLLLPVSRPLSLLTALFKAVYTAVSILGVLKLATVFHLVNTPAYLTIFGSPQLNAQVKLLLDSFGFDWSMGMVFFEIHLGLAGYLVYRSGYIPRLIGFLLVIDGLGWLVDSLRPYLYPNAHLGFIAITWFGELIFLFWLLIGGWKIQAQRLSE